MIVRLVLSFVLACAPGAQAAVVSGRIVVAPIGTIGFDPLSSAPQLTAPALGASLLSAPGLTPLSAAPAPALLPILTAPAVPEKALAGIVFPRLLAPVRVAPALALALGARPAAATPDPDKSLDFDARAAELRAAFDEKKPENTPVLPESARPGGGGLRPADPDPSSKTVEPPSPNPPKRGLLGFSRPLMFFLFALILAQVGIEAQNAGLPPLIAKVFGDVSVAAEMGMTASLADAAGTLLAPVAAKKFGLKRAYIGSTSLRVVTGGLIAGALATGVIGIAALTVLLAVDYALYGVSYTLEKSIPAVIVRQDQASLEKFKAARQIAIEGAATIVPIATGLAVASFGFLPALLAFPIAMAAAMVLVGLTLRLPAKIAGANAAPLPESGGDESVWSYFKHLGTGAAMIARTPKLLFSLLAYALVYAPTSIIYWLLAPAFGLHLAGAGQEALASGYSGMIIGLYGLGGIVAGLLVMRSQKREPGAAEMRGSMLRWTAVCAAAMGLIAAMAIPGGLIYGALTVPALAIMVFGVPQVIAKLKLEAYFQSQAPKDSIEDSTAVLEGVSSVVIAIGLWWFGKTLAGAGIASLFWLGTAIGPAILLLLALSWALARASKRD